MPNVMAPSAVNQMYFYYPDVNQASAVNEQNVFLPNAVGPSNEILLSICELGISCQ
jgi:hypothetical protein